MDPNAFEFARPYWLLAGGVACGLALWGMFWVDRWRRTALARLVHPRFHARLTPGISPGLRWAKRVLWLAAVMLLCAAAAGPSQGFEMREIKRRGIDILFAIDTSRSMLADDIEPNRLERARMGIHDFVDRLNGDRVGLVPFAGSSYPLCPLTVDYDAFRQSLDALDTDIIPKAGTDVAAAIREAQKLLETQASNHRLLVLITDGEDLQGDALDAAKEAREKGMTIYTIGVGNPEGSKIPIRLQNGQADFVRDQNGQVVVTKLDESTLKEIADKTDGLYAPLGRRAEGLETIYNEKLRMEPKNDLESKTEKIPLLRYEWPLGAALVCLLMNFLLPDRRREVKPHALPSAARRNPASGISAALAVGAALILSQGKTHAEEDARVLYNQGTEAYNAGDYPSAVARLRGALDTSDVKLQNSAYYNLGNALYKSSQDSSNEEPVKTLEDAKNAYDAALQLNPNDEDARHNRAVVQKKIDEMKNQKNDGKGGKDGKGDNKDGEKNNDQSEKDKQENKDQQQQKNGDQKDGQQDQSQQQDGQNGEQKDQQPDKQDGKEGESKPQPREGEGEQKDQQTGGGEKKDDQEKKEGQSGQTEEEKKDAEGAKEENAAGSKEGEKKEGDKQTAAEAKSTAEERKNSNEMNAEEARRLLQALRREERTVIPIDRPPPQRRFRDMNNTTKGKTW